MSGHRPWAQVKLTKKIPVWMWNRLEEHVEDNDYCPLCDCHPSHGHHDDCPLKE